MSFDAKMRRARWENGWSPRRAVSAKRPAPTAATRRAKTTSPTFGVRIDVYRRATQSNRRNLRTFARAWLAEPCRCKPIREARATAPARLDTREAFGHDRCNTRETHDPRSRRQGG